MVDFRVKISFEATYGARDEDDVRQMISDEYGLGDIECLDIDIDEVKE